MDLRQVVEQHRDVLTPADRAVLDVLLSHPTEAAFLPAEEIASRAGVHQAAATRLAKRLGFDGYPHLRASLQLELMGGVGPAERVRRRLEQTTGSDVLSTQVQDEVAALQELPRHVSQAQLDDVATRIATARRVFLFAQGNATVLVLLLQRRLRRFGVDTVVLEGPGRDVAEELLRLTDADLLLALAFRRAPALLDPLLRLAHDRGAATVVVTDVLVSLPTPPTVLLAAPRGNGRDFQSLTVPMALANALVLTVARRHPDGSLASLERLDDLLQQLDP